MKLDTGAFCRNYIQVIKRDGSVQSVGAGLLCRNDEKKWTSPKCEKVKKLGFKSFF
jgi:surface antigen